MDAPTVLIIGCGIAGPILGNFFKRKGYRPIVFEMVEELGDAGTSLMLMSNGMKVLDLVGLADAIKVESTPLAGLWEGRWTGEPLGQSDLPATFVDKYLQPAVGIRRTTFNLMLKKMLLHLGVEMREGWQLIDINEGEDSVTATFDGGRSVRGSFLIGCDGIKGVSRKILLQQQHICEGLPSYTGLTQTAGISKTPESLRGRGDMRNWYGRGVHVISYPVSPTHTSWAVTLPETPEEEETWRLYSPTELNAQSKKLAVILDGWDPVVQEMVMSAERLVKFGLFDREELMPTQWYSKRCVLVGDAAHPSSPHLGQGANQALEDCFHLSHSMPFLIPNSEDFLKASEILGPRLADTIFQPYAEKRQPRALEMIREARAQGNLRVIADPEMCKSCDEMIAAWWKDSDAIAAKYDGLLREPYESLESLLAPGDDHEAKD